MFETITCKSRYQSVNAELSDKRWYSYSPVSELPFSLCFLPSAFISCSLPRVTYFLAVTSSFFPCKAPHRFLLAYGKDLLGALRLALKKRAGSPFLIHRKGREGLFHTPHLPPRYRRADWLFFMTKIGASMWPVSVVLRLIIFKLLFALTQQFSPYGTFLTHTPSRLRVTDLVTVARGFSLSTLV